MTWEEPEFESVNMSAEIGGYYDDFAGETPAPKGASPPVIDTLAPVAVSAEPGGGRDQ